MNLKAKIILYLERHKMQKYKLEDICGVARGTIYHYLADKREMTLKTAEKINAIVG